MNQGEEDLNYMRWVLELANQEFSGSLMRLAQAAERSGLIVFAEMD